MAKAPNTAAQRVRKKIRKNVADGIAHVHASFNNTIITITDRQGGALSWASRLEAKSAFIVIWTTTAWTIPANQALNAHPELTYALVDTPRGLLVLADTLVEKCLERYGTTGTVIATTSGKQLGGLNFKHPLHDVHPGYARLAPVYLADYVSDSDAPAQHNSPSASERAAGDHRNPPLARRARLAVPVTTQ